VHDRRCPYRRLDYFCQKSGSWNPPAESLVQTCKSLIVLYQMHNPLSILYFQWVQRPHRSFKIGHFISVLASQFCKSSYLTVKLLHIHVLLYPILIN